MDQTPLQRNKELLPFLLFQMSNVLHGHLQAQKQDLQLFKAWQIVQGHIEKQNRCHVSFVKLHATSSLDKTAEPWLDVPNAPAALAMQDHCMTTLITASSDHIS